MFDENETPTTLKAIDCKYVDVVKPPSKTDEPSYTTLDELKKDGWECVSSFHSKIEEQWNDTADLVRTGQLSGDWNYGLVRGQSPEEQRDTVTYVVRRKTEQRLSWDREQDSSNKQV